MFKVEVHILIYFDNAATSFPKPNIVYEQTMEAMKEYGANPGRSGHKLALESNRAIFDARDLLAQFFNANKATEIVFTSNCTESLNLAIKGLLKPKDHVITTSMEHNSVIRPLKRLEEIGVKTTIVRANREGLIDPADIESAINENTKLIVTTHISNLTGSILPIEEIGHIARKHNIYYLVDAAQSAGVYKIDVEKMNIDMLAFPGHKGLLGPQGTGGLYIREGLDLKEMLQGGTGSSSESLVQPSLRPDKYESGTQNGSGIVGLGAGIRFINKKGIDKIRIHEEELTEHFIKEAKKIGRVKLYGPLDIKKQGAVVALNIESMDSSELSYILDERYNIAVRPGLHCTPLGHETIGTLKEGAVRFSFGLFNSHQEIEMGIRALKEIVKEI